MNIPLELVWLTAVDTNYSNISDMRCWADRLIRKYDDPHIQIITLSEIADRGQLKEIAYDTKNAFESDVQVIIANAGLGFLLASLFEGKCDLAKCLAEMAAWSDGHGSSEFDPHFFNSLLNQLEDKSLGEAEIKEFLENHLAGNIEVSRELWSSILQDEWGDCSKVN